MSNSSLSSPGSLAPPFPGYFAPSPTLARREALTSPFRGVAFGVSMGTGRHADDFANFSRIREAVLEFTPHLYKKPFPCDQPWLERLLKFQ